MMPWGPAKLVSWGFLPPRFVLSPNHVLWGSVYPWAIFPWGILPPRRLALVNKVPGRAQFTSCAVGIPEHNSLVACSYLYVFWLVVPRTSDESKGVMLNAKQVYWRRWCAGTVCLPHVHQARIISQQSTPRGLQASLLHCWVSAVLPSTFNSGWHHDLLCGVHTFYRKSHERTDPLLVPANSCNCHRHKVWSPDALPEVFLPMPVLSSFQLVSWKCFSAEFGQSGSARPRILHILVRTAQV